MFVDYFSVSVYFYGIYKLLAKKNKEIKIKNANAFGENGWEIASNFLRSWYETISYCILG